MVPGRRNSPTSASKYSSPPRCPEALLVYFRLKIELALRFLATGISAVISLKTFAVIVTAAQRIRAVMMMADVVITVVITVVIMVVIMAVIMVFVVGNGSAACATGRLAAAAAAPRIQRRRRGRLSPG